MADFRRQVPAAVADFVRAFFASISVGREKEIQWHYERGLKDISARYFAAEPWPTLGDISGIVSNRTFLVLYRLLYYKHLIMRLSSEDRPAALSTYFEAWYAYKEFFDLALGLDGSTAAADLVLPSVWVYDIVYDFVYYHERFMRRRTAITGGSSAGGGGGGDGEDGFPGDSGSGGPVTASGAPGGDRAFGLSPAAAIAAAAGGTQVSEEELAQVWQLPDVMRLLHRIVDASDVRARLADGAPVVGFRDLAGYYSLVVLCRTYTKLSDYGSAIQYAHELGVQSADGLFARTPKIHASLVLYAGFALLMSRRFEDALRVMARTLSFLHRSLRVLEDKEGASAVGIKNQVKKMLLLVAVALACCPGVEIDDLVRRTASSRHRDLIEALLAGGLGPAAQGEGETSPEALAAEAEAAEAAEAAAAAAAAAAEAESLAAGSDDAAAAAVGASARAAVLAEAAEAAAAAKAAAVSPAEALLGAAFHEACPGFLAWSMELPGDAEEAAAAAAAAPHTPAEVAAAALVASAVSNALAPTPAEAVALALAAAAAAAKAAASAAAAALATESPHAEPKPSAVAAILQSQRALFRDEVAQRTAGSVAQLRSYLRLYTSIDVAKVAAYSGLTPAEARAALTSMKIKSWSGEPAFASGGGGGFGSAGDPSGFDALHFYLDGDIVEVEEYRPPTNAAQWFVSGIDKLCRISREFGRDRPDRQTQAQQQQQQAGGADGAARDPQQPRLPVSASGAVGGDRVFGGGGDRQPMQQRMQQQQGQGQGQQQGLGLGQGNRGGRGGF